MFTAADAKRNNRDVCVDKALSLWYNEYIATIIDQLSYKLRAAGIEMVVTEESYTSKCSFLDAEEICHHDKYAGSRVKRGLFKASSGKAINADVNDSLNVGRKYLTKVGLYTEELDRQLRAAMHNPRVVKTY